MDDKKKKKYVTPKAEVVDFADEDVILTSNPFGDGPDNAEDWGAI